MNAPQDGTRRGTPAETDAASIDKDRLNALRAIVPEAFGENGIDFDRLKLALGGAVDEGKERYGLSWSGKAQSVRQLMLPSRATLVPDEKESVNFDTTQLFHSRGNCVASLANASEYSCSGTISVGLLSVTSRQHTVPTKFSSPPPRLDARRAVVGSRAQGGLPVALHRRNSE